MDKIGIKKRKIWEVLVEKSKKMRKKPKFNKHTGFNYHTDGEDFFSPKTINARYQISMSGLDFGPKNNKRTLCFYSIE